MCRHAVVQPPLTSGPGGVWLGGRAAVRARVGALYTDRWMDGTDRCGSNVVIGSAAPRSVAPSSSDMGARGRNGASCAHPAAGCRSSGVDGKPVEDRRRAGQEAQAAHSPSLPDGLVERAL